MATTINSMAVNLGMNASGFIDGAKVSRAEARLLAKDIEAARNPTEQLAVEQDRLTRALEAGAISIDVYNRLLEEKRRKLLGASEAADKNSVANGGMLDTFSKLGNITAGVRAGFDMIGAGVQFVMDKWAQFDEIANKLDATKDKAEKLGLTFSELGSLEFATKRLGGDDALKALDSAMGKMLKNGFVDAGETAVDAFKRAADEIAGMTSQTERAQRAAEIFGKSGIELLAVLQSGSAEVGALADQWERTNGLTQAQLEFIGAYNDRWEDIKLVTDGIVTIYVAEMAPALTVLADKVLGMDSAFDGVRDSARLVSDTIVATIGNAIDLMEVYEAMKNPLDANAMARALDIQTANRMLDEVMQKRLEIENELTRKQTSKRGKDDFSDLIDGNADQWESFIGDRKDGFSDLIDGNASAWDRFIDDRESKNKIATKAIADAEKALEADRKNRERIRKDVAKGPQSMEIGSAEYARHLADQANQRLAGDAVGDVKPTEQQLLDEALRQSQLMEAEAANAAEIKTKLSELIAATKENGFKRIR